MRQLLIKLKKLFSLIPGFIVLVLLIFISLFKPIKLWELNSERIGHFILDYIEHLYLLPDSKGYLNLHYFSSTKIANKWWKSFVERSLPTFGSLRSAVPIYFIFKRVRVLSFFVKRIKLRPTTLYGSRFLDHLPIGLQTLRIRFSQEENEIAMTWLREHGINDTNRIVCMMIRDSKYLEECYPSTNWSYHKYRDSKIEIFTSTINWLMARGYTVLRMGKNQAIPIQLKDHNFLDYAFQPDRSDFMDIWLFSNCRMIISTGSGPDVLGIINQIPILFVNYLPLKGHHQNAKAMVVPKILKKKFSNDLLTAREVFLADLHYAVDYETFGIEVEDLSERLLLNCVREFVSTIASGRKPRMSFLSFLEKLELPSKDLHFNSLSSVSEIWFRYVESNRNPR